MFSIGHTLNLCDKHTCYIYFFVFVYDGSPLHMKCSPIHSGLLWFVTRALRCHRHQQQGPFGTRINITNRRTARLANRFSDTPGLCWNLRAERSTCCGRRRETFITSPCQCVRYHTDWFGIVHCWLFLPAIRYTVASLRCYGSPWRDTQIQQPQRCVLQGELYTRLHPPSS